MVRSDSPVNVDDKQLEEARSMWHHFIFAIKWAVIASVVTLLLMAAFLV